MTNLEKIETYRKLQSYELVLLLKDCKKLLRYSKANEASVRLTISVIRDILIERKVI